MKIRNGFVSNSSSTSFIITNKTNEYKTIHDFLKETSFLVEDFNNEYDAEITEKEFLEDADYYKMYNFIPHESEELSFGDEDGNSAGRVLDYMLREGGESKSFKWQFSHMER